MYSIEKKDGVLEINVNFPPEIIMEYTLHIYEKFKDDYEVEGYKKGEAPLEEIEKAYGERVFFNKAISFAISYVTKNVLEENPEINYTSAPKITFVGDDENLCAYKITMPYIGIKLGRYKGLKIFCGGTLFLSADDPHREMVEQGVIRLSMNDLYEHIIETSEFEFSQGLINEQKNILLAEKQSEILAQGSTMEEYLEDECFTPEQFEEFIHKKAIHKLSENYLILKLCEIEGISATDSEVDEKIKQLALNENDTFENTKSKLGNQGIIAIKHIIESDRAYDFLRNNNKFVFNEK